MTNNITVWDCESFEKKKKTERFQLILDGKI